MGTTRELLAEFDTQFDGIVTSAEKHGASEADINRARKLFKQFYLFGAMDAVVLINPGELLLTIVRECMMNETVDEEVEEVTNASDS